MARKSPTPLAVALWAIILVGLAVLQFPGILFYHDVIEPRILGMPFIYGFNAIIWLILCVVLLIGYLTHWGRPRPENLEQETAHQGPGR